MSKYFVNLNLWKFFKLLIPAFILLTVLVFSLSVRTEQQFVYLAEAFLHGHANYPTNPGMDAVLWHGKYFWALGPFPAVLFVPFVWLGNLFHFSLQQTDLQWILILGVLFFVYKIARALAYSIEDSLVLGLAFMLGSAFIGVASVASSWYFAQVLTTFLLFWSFYEFFKRRRWWLLGTICAMILLTRMSATPVAIFFALELWTVAQTKKEKLSKYAQLLTPMLVALVLLGLYNFVRFHNVFQQGYSYQLLDPALTKARSYGIVSLIQLPGNLYAAFLSAPLPVFKDSVSHVLAFPYLQNNPWGMSIVITSPYLLYFVKLKKKAFDARAFRLIAAIFVSMTLVFLYYGIGYRQYGYRYSLDFLPAVFVLFMILYKKAHKKLSTSMNMVIIGSEIINFYLVLTFLATRGS